MCPLGKFSENLDLTNQRSMRKHGFFTSVALVSGISPDLIQVDPFALQFPLKKSCVESVKIGHY